MYFFLGQTVFVIHIIFLLGIVLIPLISNNIHLFDKALSNMKIYSAENTNIRRGRRPSVCLRGWINIHSTMLNWINVLSSTHSNNRARTIIFQQALSHGNSKVFSLFTFHNCINWNKNRLFKSNYQSCLHLYNKEKKNRCFLFIFAG